MSEKKIERVAVVGSGMMGAGIGVEFAHFGYPVALYDLTEEILKKAMQSARDALDLMVEAELITADAAEEAYGRMRTTTDLADAVSDADHVVEAAPENLSLKQELFAKMDELCPSHVSLATNSSSLRADDCAAQARNHPERILITHYWQPAPFMPLVEVIGGKRTSPAVLERVAELLRGLRKKVVVQELELSSIPAGWGNALQHPIEDVIRKMVVEKGCDPHVVDDLIRFGFGRRYPFTATFIRYDIMGLDFFYDPVRPRPEPPWPPFKEKVERGELGMKSHKGFYEWPGDTAKQFLRNFYLELIRLMKIDMEKGDI